MNEERLIDMRIRALDLAMMTPPEVSISSQGHIMVSGVAAHRREIAQTYLDFLCNAQPASSADATTK